MSEDRFEKLMRDAAETFHRPPEPPLEEMWAEIEARAGFRAAPTVESVTPITAARRRGFRVPTWAAAAATLVIGIGIGRVSTVGGHPTVASPPQMVAKIDSTPAPADTQLDRPYAMETSQYLGQTAALLTSLSSDSKSAADAQFSARASDLLARTRLLMDSPAANEPAMRDLLEDLELVLAQVVRLRSNGSRTDLDIINRALEQRDVIPRLRTAVADISAN
jgi:uncharacterized membrane-anchored protein YhcB (DUF1043 family)